MRRALSIFLLCGLASSGLAGASVPVALWRAPEAGAVAWQAWDDTLPARARAANKPVYLFVGAALSELTQATARQTLARPETAAWLNEHFFCVLVDREAQPAVAVQAQAYLRVVKQIEGWPAQLWLTPELQPFEGAAYLPPSEEWGKPGFLKVAQQALSAWSADPAECRARAAEAVALLAAPVVPFPSDAHVAEKSRGRLSSGADIWRDRFDPVHGGFGDAPKNAEPELLRFLLRQGPVAAEPARRTLRALVASPVRDPLDGGFFRAATDAGWQLPIPQKILSDQARIALACLDAATGEDRATFLAAARGGLDYALTRLRRADGTFAAAEDATAEEAAGYHAWTAAEIDTLLGADAAAFKTATGVQPTGNVPAELDAAGRYTGKNLLRAVPTTVLPGADRLLAARDRRPGLARDERATAGAHGLLLVALARAGVVCAEPRYLRAAAELRAAVEREFAGGGELRRLAGADYPAAPTDYLALAWGCRELALAVPASGAEASARRWRKYADETFFDAATGRYAAAPATLPAGLFFRSPALPDPLTAEALAIFAGEAAPATVAALQAAWLAQAEESPLPQSGDTLLAWALSL